MNYPHPRSQRTRAEDNVFHQKQLVLRAHISQEHKRKLTDELDHQLHEIRRASEEASTSQPSTKG